MDNTMPTTEENYYLVDGIKVRRRTFGKKPVSERFAVPKDLTVPKRSPFMLYWEDVPEGLSAVVAELESGRMIASVTAKGNTKFTAMSVAIVGNVEYEWLGKTIKLVRVNETTEYGMADFGPLSDLAKRLGDEWVIVVSPVL